MALSCHFSAILMQSSNVPSIIPDYRGVDLTPCGTPYYLTTVDRVGSGSVWGRSGVDLGSIWDRFRDGLGSVWDRFEGDLGSI